MLFKFGNTHQAGGFSPMDEIFFTFSFPSFSFLFPSLAFLTSSFIFISFAYLGSEQPTQSIGRDDR
jgi:hypothetical protein